MKPYFVKTPRLIRNYFSDYTWNITTDKKEIYLTFDDGPIPEITPWVLNVLKEYQAKATFFCIGDNIKKYPQIFQQILKENHSIGNHSFNHLNGWKTNPQMYLNNIEITEKVFKSETKNKKIKNGNNEIHKQATNNQQLTTNLFRPPYGRIRSKQTRLLIKKGYQIIMWDILSGDFDQNISKEACYQNVIKNVQKGSIIVFHDSKKAFKKLDYALPKVLNYFTERGYTFKVL